LFILNVRSYKYYFVFFFTAFQKKYCEFNTKSHQRPSQFVWYVYLYLSYQQYHQDIMVTNMCVKDWTHTFQELDRKTYFWRIFGK